jgi:hypothetical protein
LTLEGKLAEVTSSLRSADDGYGRLRSEAAELQQTLSTLLAEPFLAEVRAPSSGVLIRAKSVSSTSG